MFSLLVIDLVMAIYEQVCDDSDDADQSEALKQDLEGSASHLHQDRGVGDRVVRVFFVALLPLVTFLFENFSRVITSNLFIWYLLTA